jgi:hypothetical protein
MMWNHWDNFGNAGEYMTGQAIGISYQEQARDDFYNEITLDEQNRVSYFSAFSEPGMPVRDLGTRYVLLDSNDPDLIKIRKIVSDHNMTQAIIRLDPKRPGGLYKKFIISYSGQDIPNIIDQEFNPPPPLDVLEQELESLLRSKKFIPIRSFTIQYQLDAAKIWPGRTNTLKVRFVNSGKFGVLIGNPVSFSRHLENSFKLNIYRNDKNETGANGIFEFALDLVGNEIKIGPRDTLRSDQPLLKLEPGEIVEGTINIKLPKCRTGTYTSELVYIYDAREQKQAEIVGGEWHGNFISFEIVAPNR